MAQAFSVPLAHHRHKAHRRFADRLRIGGIILLALDEGLHIGGRDKLHLVPRVARLSAPEMRSSDSMATMHSNWLKNGSIWSRLSFLRKKHVARGKSPMHLEHILRQIESDSGNLRRERSPTSILADPSCHTDAVGCGYIIRLNKPGWTNIQRPKIEPVATNPVKSDW